VCTPSETNFRGGVCCNEATAIPKMENLSLSLDDRNMESIDEVL